MNQITHSIISAIPTKTILPVITRCSKSMLCPNNGIVHSPSSRCYYASALVSSYSHTYLNFGSCRSWLRTLRFCGVLPSTNAPCPVCTLVRPSTNCRRPRTCWTPYLRPSNGQSRYSILDAVRLKLVNYEADMLFYFCNIFEFVPLILVSYFICLVQRWDCERGRRGCVGLFGAAEAWRTAAALSSSQHLQRSSCQHIHKSCSCRRQEVRGYSCC